MSDSQNNLMGNHDKKTTLKSLSVDRKSFCKLLTYIPLTLSINVFFQWYRFMTPLADHSLQWEMGNLIDLLKGTLSTWWRFQDGNITKEEWCVELIGNKFYSFKDKNEDNIKIDWN